VHAEPASPPRPGAASPRSPTPPFVWTATLLALSAGFGLGAGLFAHPAGAWWPAAAQAHGHAQLFGWAGLLVLGVSFHFLPRLRGAPLAGAGLVPWVLALYGGGVALRVLLQPLAAGTPALAGVLPLTALLELAGALLAVGVLGVTLWRGAPLQTRLGLSPVLPYFVLGFFSLLASLLLNALGLAAAAATGAALVPAPWQPLLIHLTFFGFLVPLSLAMSARTFPLYLGVRPPSSRALAGVLGGLGIGLGLRLAGMGAALSGVEALGSLVEGVALLAAAWVLDAPLGRTRGEVAAAAQARARALGVAPRSPAPLPPEVAPANALLRTAYAWLVLAALLLLAGAAARLGAGPVPPADAERHALGAGFIALLILGMGARLLPGFLGRRLASARLVWVTLWLGNAAAVLRAVPALVPWLLAMSGGPASPLRGVLAASGALAGLVDLVAVAALGWNLWRTWRGGETRAIN